MENNNDKMVMQILFPFMDEERERVFPRRHPEAGVWPLSRL